jgi:hypothetical protein
LSGDEDPTKVEELIVGIRRGLAQGINLPDANLTSETPVEELEGSQDDSKAETNSSADQDEDKLEVEDGDESSDNSLDTFMDSKSKPSKE